jgi:hypothetical protein
MSRQPPPAVLRAQLEAFRGRASCVAGTLATLQAKSQTAIEFLKNHLVNPLQASGKDVSGVIEALDAIAQSSCACDTLRCEAEEAGSSGFQVQQSGQLVQSFLYQLTEHQRKQAKSIPAFKYSSTAVVRRDHA